jgi:hypothetical protein
LPQGDRLEGVLDAAGGFTRAEAENAFSLSLIRHGRVTPDVLWELKGQTLKKSGLLTLHRGGETFADLGGLDAIKSFCNRALWPGRRSDVRARGVLFCSVLQDQASRRAPRHLEPKRDDPRYSRTSVRSWVR